jgi:S-adenosylmethionine:tRNA ribosyltransferase-isomerase
MRISDFDYSLPAELIAQYPPVQRRDSRLLDVSGGFSDRRFTDLPDLLRKGDLLVFNDSRVIPARLHGHKDTGGRVEVLIERVTTDTDALAHVRASKSPKLGGRLVFDDGVEAEVTRRDGQLFALKFSEAVLPLLERHGEVPLPPYLNRLAEPDDKERYQTVYAREPGAVAAPTAGLHFDAEMLDQLSALGVRYAWVTLHVGAGTFQALRHDNIAENRLHCERVRVGASVYAAVRETRAANGRVIAVGTTSVRALESAAAHGAAESYEGETDLFIRPGYRFQSVDAMLTNFHLPKSSLLMLVAAFAGTQRILEAYEHAVRERYRFFSYGDAMFLTPGSQA